MQHRVSATPREEIPSEPAKRNVFQCGLLLQLPRMLVYYRKADSGRRGTVLLIGRRKLVSKVVPVAQAV